MSNEFKCVCDAFAIGFPRARTRPLRSPACSVCTAHTRSTAHSARDLSVSRSPPITVPFLSQSANSAADRASGMSNRSVTPTLLLAVLRT
jgi:hypothetical protein